MGGLGAAVGENDIIWELVGWCLGGEVSAGTLHKAAVSVVPRGLPGTTPITHRPSAETTTGGLWGDRLDGQRNAESLGIRIWPK